MKIPKIPEIIIPVLKTILELFGPSPKSLRKLENILKEGSTCLNNITAIVLNSMERQTFSLKFNIRKNKVFVYKISSKIIYNFIIPVFIESRFKSFLK